MTDSPDTGGDVNLELTPEKYRQLSLEFIARLKRLAEGLAEARAILESAEVKSSGRRLAFVYSTASLVEFIQSLSFFTGQGLEKPLVELFLELQDVALGIPSDDFAVKPGKRKRGLRLKSFQLQCALLLESYMQAGVPRKEAGERIARLLTGFTVAPGTIEYWRQELSDSSGSTGEGKRFAELRADFSKIKFSEKKLDESAKRIAANYSGLRTGSQANRVSKKRAPLA
jgi:hypothetical protein